MALQKETVADLIIDIVITNFTSRPVDYTTKLNKHLRTDDGYGSASSKNIFMGLIVSNFYCWGYQEPSWPDNWMDMTVKDLAVQLAQKALPL